MNMNRLIPLFLILTCLLAINTTAVAQLPTTDTIHDTMWVWQDKIWLDNTDYTPIHELKSTIASLKSWLWLTLAVVVLGGACLIMSKRNDE